MHLIKTYTSYKVLSNRVERMCIDCNWDRRIKRKEKNVMNGSAELWKYKVGSENGKVSD